MLTSSFIAIPLFLAAVANAAPLADASPVSADAIDAAVNVKPIEAWDSSLNLIQARAGPPVAPDMHVLEDIMMTHWQDWNRAMAEAQRAGFHSMSNLPPAEVQRIQGILAAGGRAQDGMQRVQLEMERMVELERQQRLRAQQLAAQRANRGGRS
ncbi:hypothetical protein OC834_006986 [Tilletia horrida]|uniref:Secreted protein n=1 Tax=Tilletia horrida TaxID=155126 RepID=A0AAN6JH50_9BASI|nr:hypothetical protein OC842_007268 [Tilletia horrida]KAK0520574.1 hypothetical protein OC834_006986 [Tilletia horrida]KAK0528372.1 hypothetical protein OC835_004690 [Tilletia horrida]KAK0546627.1 hypothetical protein OC844_007238 [Tilletia horrida]